MRWLFAFLVILAPLNDAAAAVESMQPRDYSKLLDKENVEFLRNLKMLLEAKGFKDVQMLPQMFVAAAKDAAGKEITIIVDYNTLRAFSFEGGLPLLGIPEDSQPETVLPRLR